MEKIRVFITDDHPVLRAALRALISGQADMEVVGEAGSVREVLSVVSQAVPDVLCLDLDMPHASGLTAVGPLRAAYPDLKIVILTCFTDPTYVRAAIATGVHGYVAKTATSAELLHGIRSAHQNRITVQLGTAAASSEGSSEAHSGKAETSPGLQTLSARELEVFKFLALGFTNREIADRLFLSVKTVETYRSRLAEKLGLKSRAEFLRFALELGILEVSGLGPGQSPPDLGEPAQPPSAEGER